MKPQPREPTVAERRLTLLLLLPVLLAGTAWSVALHWPQWLGLLGIADYGTPFLDFHSILAALDAVRAGLDPHQPIAFDALGRPLAYSDWWLALKWAGLTRAHNLPVGLALVTAFGTAACLTARPKTWREALWLAVILMSPPVLLAVVRGNNDLVIFVLLASCGAVLAGENRYRWLVAVLGIGLATGLKYYPVVAVLALLWFRPARQVPVVFGAGLLVAGLALVSVLPDLQHAPLAVPPGIHTMGAPILWRDLGLTDAQARVPAVLLFVAAGMLLVRTGVTAGLATRGEPRERVLAVFSVSLLLACFISGIGYAYRWVFIVWVALWLWRRAGEDAPSRQRWAAVVACGLTFLSLWADGILCLVVNQLPRQSPAWIEHLLLAYRAWTQPPQWLLMALFAGWLLEAVIVHGREWRRQRAA
jgi:hypothetical protein